MKPSNGAENISDFQLNHLRREDMRAKVEMHAGDLVRVTGTHTTGRIIEFDPDGRLARLVSTVGDGWWYVKDLELEKHNGSSKPTKGEQGQLFSLRHSCDPDKYYARFGRYPTVMIEKTGPGYELDDKVHPKSDSPTGDVDFEMITLTPAVMSNGRARRSVPLQVP